jgi:small subunit ribosomal protein S3e
LLKLPVRKVAISTIKHIMECKAKGVQVIISGKLTGQRAKATKYGDGFMIGSGDAKRDYLVEGVRHVLLPTGILGVKVRIMLPQSDRPESNKFVKRQMDDYVFVRQPVEEEVLEQAIVG